MVGAIVNNNIVPLNYELQNNDIVKINTNKSSTPSKEWLNIAKATQTKNKIKSYFSKNEKENYIERGKYNLEKELRKRRLSFSAHCGRKPCSQEFIQGRVPQSSFTILCHLDSSTAAPFPWQHLQDHSGGRLPSLQQSVHHSCL